MLSAKQECLVKLFCIADAKKWNLLPECAENAIQAGATPGELRSTLRQLVMCVYSEPISTSAGYGPALKAFLVLKGAGKLPESSPGKVGGLPGDAWKKVYKNRADRVQQIMHEADETLHDWMLLHAYGDVMSSPGLDLAQKELLMVSFLAVSDMPDQLFGHILAAVQNGNTIAQVKHTIHIAFECYQGPDKLKHQEESEKILERAGSHPDCQRYAPETMLEKSKRELLHSRSLEKLQEVPLLTKKPTTPPREHKMQRRLSEVLA